MSMLLSSSQSMSMVILESGAYSDLNSHDEEESQIMIAYEHIN
jgi:hypothetical protein